LFRYIFFLIFFVSTIFNVTAEIQTSADEVSIDIKKKVVVLSGRAKVKRDNGMIFTSRVITIVWQDWKCRKPKSIEAVGNVRFEYDGTIVTAETCKCDMKKVQFIDNVIVTNKEVGEIKADIATYDMKSRKIRIFSIGEKRVTLRLDEKKVIAGKKKKRK
jgi:lipopolysaccharide export system protein LptA